MAPGLEADWQVREWVGKAGAGPGSAGGCGPASPPPPRDYLVPAAAMSPGRNVPPQIMLFISLGGSAARQHQAPGGRCARSPALPSSPCAAAAATPGLGVAATTAPAQVSPGRARRPEGAGCGCGCARQGRAARAQRRRWAPGARDARGPGDRVGTQPWVPGVEPVGGPGGCGSYRPGARESSWVSAALGKLGACFGEPDPGASPGGAGRAVRGVRVLVPGCLLQDPGVGTKGVLPQACRTSALPSLPGSSALGPLRFSSGELVCALPGSPAPRQGGQGGGGAGSPSVGNDAECGQVQPQEGEISVPQATLQGPPPFLSQRVPLLQAATVHSTLPCLTGSSFSDNLALRNSRKWEK